MNNTKNNTENTSDRKAGKIEDKIYFMRLNYSERVQHIIFVSCFLIQVVTGFMIKTPEEVVKILGQFGGKIFFFRGIMHRTFGIVMILVALYHIYYLIFKPGGRRWISDMIPKFRDLKEMIANYLYLLGIRDKPPEFERFCYKHKIEYGALTLGFTLMSVTGIILWTEYRWSRFLLDIATIVHGMEAILACIAIIIWHLYEIHLKPRKFPMSRMWITGLMDEEEMKEEHLLQYKRIMADPELRDIYIKRKKAD